MSKKVKQTEIEAKTEKMMFGVEDAVEVLVTKYLANVAAKLKPLTDALDRVREANATTIDRIKESIDTSEYNHTSTILGISSRVQDVKLNVGKTIEDSNIRVVLMLTDLDITGERYTPEFGKFRNLEMSTEIRDEILASNDTVETAEKNVREVRNLEDTSTVRRQLHAKVMEVKLVEAGLTDIFDNEEIAAILSV